MQALLLCMASLLAPIDQQAVDSSDTRPCIKKIRIGGESLVTKKVSVDSFDHSTFDRLLNKYVNCDGWVCYADWKCDSAARQELYDYLVSLGEVDLSQPATREAKLAFYINSYNALVIWGMLHFYPTPSIQKHNGKDAPFRIFDDLEVWIDGEYMSLNVIEHDELRKMKDPRIHFALVCAARGCPKLRREAYTAANIDFQLTENSVDFFSNNNRFHICKVTGTVKLSPIIMWFKEDFGTSDRNIIESISPFVSCKDREWLEKHPCPKIRYMGYNWAINDDCATFGVRFKVIPYAVYARFEPYIRNFRDQPPIPPLDEVQEVQPRDIEKDPTDKKIKKMDVLSMTPMLLEPLKIVEADDYRDVWRSSCLQQCRSRQGIMR